LAFNIDWIGFVLMPTHSSTYIVTILDCERDFCLIELSTLTLDVDQVDLFSLQGEIAHRLASQYLLCTLLSLRFFFWRNNEM
jgi:hypothetical protein